MRGGRGRAAWSRPAARGSRRPARPSSADEPTRAPVWRRDPAGEGRIDMRGLRRNPARGRVARYGWALTAGSPRRGVMGSWQVHALGERASLVLGEDGLRLDGTRPHRWTW